jgi:hypothetical protein
MACSNLNSNFYLSPFIILNYNFIAPQACRGYRCCAARGAAHDRGAGVAQVGTALARCCGRCAGA